ncbi:hypothetical protein GCM10009830_19320 [Glycomyces endophyticus]|uniref:PNPLA domain-containing protein n=1 Tax=Glycomyces endophyticus TaxID=480996 RepID=A0ABN2GLA4_9ACTN
MIGSARSHPSSAVLRSASICGRRSTARSDQSRPGTVEHPSLIPAPGAANDRADGAVANARGPMAPPSDVPLLSILHVGGGARGYLG